MAPKSSSPRGREIRKKRGPDLCRVIGRVSFACHPLGPEALPEPAEAGAGHVRSVLESGGAGAGGGGDIVAADAQPDLRVGAVGGQEEAEAQQEGAADARRAQVGGDKKVLDFDVALDGVLDDLGVGGEVAVAAQGESEVGLIGPGGDLVGAKGELVGVGKGVGIVRGGRSDS